MDLSKIKELILKNSLISFAFSWFNRELHEGINAEDCLEV